MTERLAPVHQQSPEFGRGNLLVIDDEEEILKALRRQFRRDYDVYTASSASEAYQIMIEHPIQVIISDQRMPGTTGSEFFSRVKEDFPDAMRLLLTGYADIQGVISAINEGNIFRYITKPWDPHELAGIVSEAFTRYSIVAENRTLTYQLIQAKEVLEENVRDRTLEIEDANNRLREIIEQKDVLLGMAAHDLRTPIAVIQGFTDLLMHPKTPPDDARQFVDIIRETLRDMLNLLNNLLDITAIESGKLNLNMTRSDPKELVTNIVRLNRMLAEQKQIAIMLDIEEQVAPFVFDPTRIKQVMNNLISNALKFSYSGTTVTVKLSRTDGGVEFSVSDQGVGIKPDEIGKLFSEFQRTSNKPTGNESSIGLGLSICKRIVELHNGTICVESEYGEGSRFYFTLPS
jgi:signal transduction histidine kinase